MPSLEVDGPDSAGARLFVDRAALVVDPAVDDGAVDGAASPESPDSDPVTIVEIARRLDGIPLAIELAAGQVAAFSPAQILELLDDRFALLEEQQRRVPQRHQTLAATLEWSYELLSDDHRRALRTLSACNGAFSPATAARVLGSPLTETERLLDELAAKSLLVPAPEGRDPVGYTFLETVPRTAERCCRRPVRITRHNWWSNRPCSLPPRTQGTGHRWSTTSSAPRTPP